MSKKVQCLNSQDLDSQRRDFLRGSIVAAAGVAVTAAAGKSIASVSEPAAEMEADKKEGYRLTKHIADYYKSAAI